VTSRFAQDSHLSLGLRVKPPSECSSNSRLNETHFRLNNKPRLREMRNQHTRDTHGFSLGRVTLA